jgi:phosphatidate phosphatase APP1
VTVSPGENGGALNALDSAPSIQLPFETTDEGDFDAFVTLQNVSSSDGKYLVPGNETTYIQALNVYTEGTDTGNATAYLVPPTGTTIVSDIDDILRVTKIYVPKDGLDNTFAEPFTPWMNMPQLYANWSHIPDLHFHYLTTTPEQITRNYMESVFLDFQISRRTSRS